MSTTCDVQQLAPGKVPGAIEDDTMEDHITTILIVDEVHENEVASWLLGSGLAANRMDSERLVTGGKLEIAARRIVATRASGAILVHGRWYGESYDWRRTSWVQVGWQTVDSGALVLSIHAGCWLCSEEPNPFSHCFGASDICHANEHRTWLCALTWRVRNRLFHESLPLGQQTLAACAQGDPLAYFALADLAEEGRLEVTTDEARALRLAGESLMQKAKVTV